jgi:transaldolase
MPQSRHEHGGSAHQQNFTQPRRLGDFVDGLDFYNIKTVVISASIKSCYDAIQSIIAGADSIALTYPIFCQLLDHPVTREGIERFTDDYNSVYDK